MVRILIVTGWGDSIFGNRDRLIQDSQIEIEEGRGTINCPRTEEMPGCEIIDARGQVAIQVNREQSAGCGTSEQGTERRMRYKRC